MEPSREASQSSMVATITTFGVSRSEDKDIPPIPQGTDPGMLFSDALDTMRAHGTGVIGKMETGTMKAWTTTRVLPTISQA